MKQDEATNAIHQRFIDNWPTLAPDVGWVFDDEGAGEASSYARVQINSLPSVSMTMGDTALQRRWGMIKVKLNGPADVGRVPLDRLANFVRKIYERKRFGAGTNPVHPAGVVCHETSVRELGSDGMFWTLMVETSFYFDETVPT